MKARRHNRRGDRKESNRRKRGKSRRWLAILPIALVTTITLIWLAPMIIAHTTLKQRILSAAFSDFEGSVTVESASLGWMSPILASNIEALDRDGQPLAQVKSLRSEKSLIGLLTDRTRPGQIYVEESTVHVVLRDDGSNWQDALSYYLAGPDGDSAINALTLHVVGGQVEIRDSDTGQGWQIAQLNGALQYAVDEAVPVKLHAEAAVGAAGRSPGEVAVDLDWQPSQDAGGGLGEGQLTLRGDAMPLGPIAAAAKGVLGNVRLEGTANCDAVCQWSEAAGSRRIQIDNVTTDSITVIAPQWLGDERPRTTRLNGSAQLEGSRDRWRIEQLALETDFATIEARGSVPSAALASADFWTHLTRYLSEDDAQVQGRVDLAQLAGMLPSDLDVGQAKRISSGSADFSVGSQSGETPGFTARLELSDLVTADGRGQLQPILLAAKVRHTTDGLAIDQMTCESSFLTLTAQGTLSEGSAVIQGDLDRMAAEAGHFIDFSDCRLAGQLEGNLRWEQSSGGHVAAAGRMDLQEFQLSLSDDDRWVEKHLSVELAAMADVRQGRFEQVLSGSLAVNSDDDQLVATLTEPVAHPAASSLWPVQVKASGELATWLPRLKPILPSGPWQLAGVVNLDATARVSPAVVDAQSIDLQIVDFRARQGNLAVDEPKIHLQATGRWDAHQRLVTAQDATMTSSTIALRAQQVIVRIPPAPMAASGSLSYRGNVQRLYRYWTGDDPANRNQLSGTVTGVVQASHESGVTQVDWNSEATDLAYASRPAAAGGGRVLNAAHASDLREVWREPVVKLAGRQRYDQERDSLDIDAFSIQADSIHLSTQGRIDSLCGRPVADLTGEVDCDLADLTRKLSPVLGPNIQLAGRDKSQFTIRGPLAQLPNSATGAQSNGASPVAPKSSATGGLVSPQLAGDARLAWQSAMVHGLSIGRADLAASLDAGVIQFAPLQVPVSEGRLLAQPHIDLRSSDATMRVGKGPLIENVRISPEMCQTWLKYVTPLLADATRAEGRFSVALDSASVPLLDQARSDVHGRLTIHQAQVGPGPLAQQFISIAQQVKAVIDGRPLGTGGAADSNWLLVREQTVPFDVADGRVHHQGLVVSSGDVQIRSSGTVGLDETLALVAEVPIRDSWVSGKAYLNALKGTTIKVPVGGTLSKPQVDGGALRDLSRQMLGGAARGVLEGELNRGLQELFGR